jgi:CheY-like chemotaxis protein
MNATIRDRRKSPRPALAVDDQEGIRSLVCRTLILAGYATIQARDGGEALQVLESGARVDLMVTDLHMPVLQGDELARRARSCRPELKILHMTAFVDHLFLDRSVLWADEAFLEKPFTVTGLKEAVSLLMSGTTNSQNDDFAAGIA